MVGFKKEEVFVVTGASSGIGEGVALLLNELGATVIGIGRNAERLEGMKAKCKHPGNMFLEQKELTEDVQGLPAYVKSLKDKYGKFSGLAYCAGITLNQPLQMKDYQTSRHLFDIDYFAPMFFAKAFGDRRNTVGRGTSMVFVSSAAAQCASRAMSDYCGAKAALSHSCRCIAKELAPHGIRVNCVLPADIITPMTLADPDILASKSYPMGVGEVLDVANLVVFLLSDKAKWITGQNYVIDCASF